MASSVILLLAFVVSTQAFYFGPGGFYPQSYAAASAGLPLPYQQYQNYEPQPYQNYEPWNPFKIFENFPFMNFRPFPAGGFQIPTPADVASMVPGPNQNFNGMTVSSTSFYTKDKDGNLVKDGGTTILINDNGNIHHMSLGKNPPGVDGKIPPMNIPEFVMPPMPEMLEMPQMPEFPSFFPAIQPIPPTKPTPPTEPVLPVKPINTLEVKPINFEKIKNAKPGANENIQIVTSSSHSQYSDVDGVQKSRGGAHSMVNINGNVRQETVEFNNIPEGGKPRGDKNPSGDQRPEKLTKGIKLVKHSKSSKSATANDINPDIKPKQDFNTNVVQNKN
ncbi:uncharacterized protein LOC113230368 isoform X2 [Hyposmocoma kahamanoa]|uniref:uncharacterized protein LOC113230368 isoform X2 n=1 Tax=Hyposmocoma kahamanoa TaxID=1477025 RepID=UPI000E6D5CB9|nr:uncharacterized protein LOC113230368 isoform X2 [Hyposmocoma kahamanoa]